MQNDHRSLNVRLCGLKVNLQPLVAGATQVAFGNLCHPASS